MNNSFYKLVGFILFPFIILYFSWLIIGESFSNLLIQIINSALTNLLIVIGIATLCSWWFCLTRSSKIIVSISLSAVFMILFLFIYYLFSFETLQPSGLNTSIAILLNSGLQSLTILLSFVFVLIIGILITKEPYREEE